MRVLAPHGRRRRITHYLINVIVTSFVLLKPR